MIGRPNDSVEATADVIWLRVPRPILWKHCRTSNLYYQVALVPTMVLWHFSAGIQGSFTSSLGFQAKTKGSVSQNDENGKQLREARWLVAFLFSLQHSGVSLSWGHCNSPSSALRSWLALGATRWVLGGPLFPPHDWDVSVCHTTNVLGATRRSTVQAQKPAHEAPRFEWFSVGVCRFHHRLRALR